MMFRTQAGDAASGQLDDSSPIGRPPPPTHPPPPWDLLAVGPRPPRWTPIEDLITYNFTLVKKLFAGNVSQNFHLPATVRHI